MRAILVLAAFAVCVFAQVPSVADVLALTSIGAGPDGSFCMDFSPYVSAPNGAIYTPGGFEPPESTVEALLESLINTGRIKCILVYGSQGAASFVPGIIRRRGWAGRLKVIQGAWLDGPPTTVEANNAQIAGAIALSKAYEDVIVAMQCGSEVRLRHHRGIALEVVMPCLAQARAAGVKQPLTHQATWPEWCNEEFPGELFPRCERWEPLASAVDYISQTAYEWWENRVKVRFPCMPAQDAAEFHLDRQLKVAETYAGYRPVIMSEVGHPGPRTLFVDTEAGAPCSTASKDIQMMVSAETLSRCRAEGQSCILFNAFDEPWKAAIEGTFGGSWGLCESFPPYACTLPTLFEPGPKSGIFAQDGAGNGGGTPGTGGNGTQASPSPAADAIPSITLTPLPSNPVNAAERSSSFSSIALSMLLGAAVYGVFAVVRHAF